jgi:D-beta-D-heptose 7-phosphate kinase/D-beta-D-heptose 1-phosphate adenosyltransferase
MSLASPGPAALVATLERFRGLTVWVVGDLMVDEYLSGSVERISPEAPVPVVRVRGVEQRLGGAANVARQCAALGARTVLAGAIGSDPAGAALLAQCAAAGIDTSAVVEQHDRHTTRKLRVLGPAQQLLRVDWEDTTPCSAAATDEMMTALKGGQPNVIILSDYAKGVLTPQIIATLIAHGREQDCPVLVDPKHADLGRYRGASVVTPNLRELEQAVGHPLDAADSQGLAAAARPLLESASLGALLVTLGEHGMLAVPARGEVRAIPAVPRAVFDVTGAGDTAIAVLALGVGAGADLASAAVIANAAAGLAVGEIGTVAIDAARLRAALAASAPSKILSREDLAARAESWHVAGKRIVFTNGCFDLLHAGHLALLHEAAALGDVLVLAINSDESVRRLKGPSRPVVPEADRAALLAALACVDAVTVYPEDTPLATLALVRPHVLVKGQDYTREQVVGRELVEASGGRVALVPLLPQKSTSALVERIRAGQGST